MGKQKYQLPLRTLHDACATGDIGFLSTALRNAAANVNKPDVEGNAPLHIAATYGKGEVVAYLIREHHADVDLRTTTGHTPLMCATRNGKFSVVKMLLEAGADPSLYNNSLLTAEDYAVEMSHSIIVSYLRSNIAMVSYRPAEAVAKGNLHRLKHLVDTEGWKPNASAFHSALSSRVFSGVPKQGTQLFTDKQTATLTWILQQDPSLVNSQVEGKPHPLMSAIEADDMALVKLLVSFGADVETHIQREGEAKPLPPAQIAKQLGRHDIASFVGLHAAQQQYASLIEQKKAVHPDQRQEWVTSLRSVKKERTACAAECESLCIAV